MYVHSNGLHFTIVHSGTPDIDPDKHRLVIHGLVKRPLAFTARRALRASDGVAHDIRRVRGQQRPMFSKTHRPCRICTASLSCAEMTCFPPFLLLLEENRKSTRRRKVASYAEGADLARP